MLLRGAVAALTAVLLFVATPAFGLTVGSQPAATASLAQSLPTVIVTASQAHWWTVTTAGHALVVIGVPDYLSSHAHSQSDLFGTAPSHAQYIIKWPTIKMDLGFSWLWKRGRLTAACRLGDGQRLNGMLNAVNFAQWQELSKRYKYVRKHVEQFAPGCVATQLLLRFEKVNGLNLGRYAVWKRMIGLVQGHDAKIFRPGYTIEHGQHFIITQAKLVQNPGLDCMNHVLEFAGHDLQKIKLQNHLWASGDIARSFAVQLTSTLACNVSIQDGYAWSGMRNPFVMARLRWVDTAQAMLRKYTFGIAVLPYGAIKQGYLELLKERGYAVHVPPGIGPALREGQ